MVWQVSELKELIKLMGQLMTWQLLRESSESANCVAGELVIDTTGRWVNE